MTKTDGVTALYKGLIVCLVGDVLYRGLKYGFYDGFLDEIIGALSKLVDTIFKRQLLKEIEDYAIEFVFSWAYGWFISALVSTILMPIDTVRRVMITQSTHDNMFEGFKKFLYSQISSLNGI